MPYKITKKKCKQSDGDAGNHVLSYTDGKGKDHDNCHTSKKGAQGQIAAIEGDNLAETDDMVFGGGGDTEAEEEESGEPMDEALIREFIREKLLSNNLEEGLPRTPWLDQELGKTRATKKNPNPTQRNAPSSTWLELVQRIDPGTYKVNGTKASYGLDGIDISTRTANADPTKIVNDLAEAARETYGLEDVNVVGPASSGQTYDIWKIEYKPMSEGGPSEFAVVVRPTGEGSAKRIGTGGYEYESNFRENLRLATQEFPGITVSNNIAQDIAISCNNMTIGIETKMLPARGGSLFNLFWDGSSLSAKPESLSKKDPQLKATIEAAGGEPIVADKLNAWATELAKEPLTSFPTGHNGDMSQDGYGISKEQYDRIAAKIGGTKNIYKGELPLSSFLEYYAEHGVQYLQFADRGIFLTRKGVDPLDLGVEVLPDTVKLSPVQIYWRKTGVFKLRIESQISGDPGQSSVNPEDPTQPGFNVFWDKLVCLCEELCGGFEEAVEEEGAVSSAEGEDIAGENEEKEFIERAIMSGPVLRAMIRQRLTEDLSRADKSEIARIFKKEMAKTDARKAIRKEIESTKTQTLIDKAFKKQFDKELKKALGSSFFGTPGKINKFVVDEIQKEVEKTLGDSATRELVVDICKDVIIKLYRELSFTYQPVIKRLKV